MTKHTHNWVKIYYRKFNKDKVQEWVVIKDKLICNICEEIREIR